MHLKFHILLLSSFLFSSYASAKIEFLWSGIAGIYLTDGKTSLYFDPVFSRPNIPELLLGLSYRVDEKMVKSELDRLKIKKTDAIFICHTHTDHAIDMHVVQKLTGGIIHGSQSAVYLNAALGIPKDKVKLTGDGDEFTYGDFKIKVLETVHGKILGLYEFRGGSLKAPLKEKPSLSDYVMGGSFSYFITHPEGNFLVQQSSRFTQNIKDEIKGKKFKAVFQGIANRKSTADLYTNFLNLAAQIDSVIPIHHDNFFLKRDRYKVDLLWGVKMDEFINYSKNKKQQLIIPKYDKRYTL